MTFSVLQRIILLNALPQQGDILSLRAARKLREDLSFSDQELTDYKIIQTTDSAGRSNYQWNRASEQPKEIAIGTATNAMIAKALNSLSESGTLTNDHLSLCDRFIPAVEELAIPDQSNSAVN